MNPLKNTKETIIKEQKKKFDNVLDNFSMQLLFKISTIFLISKTKK